MSVTAVQEKFMERGGSQTLEGTTITRMFQVFTDDVNDDLLVVLSEGQSFGLPKMRQDHPDTAELWVDNITPRPYGSDGLSWKVSVSYGLKPPAQPVTGDVKPWDLDPVIIFGYVARQRVMEKAYSLDQTIAAAGATRGQPQVPVKATNDKPFDPPAMLEDYLLTISIGRNIKHDDFDPTDPYTYQNTINTNDPITIAGISVPEFCGLCRDYRAQKAWTEQNEAYWQEQIEVVLDPETWIRKLVSVGICEKVGVEPSPSNKPIWAFIKDDKGIPMNDPVPLDANGQAAPAGQQGHIMEYHALWEQDWSGMSLPSSY